MRKDEWTKDSERDSGRCGKQEWGTEGEMTGDRNPLELVAVAEDDVLDTEQSGVKAVQGRGW